MKKVLSAFLVALVILLCAAPIFSYAVTAPFTITSTFTKSYIEGIHCNYSVIASDGILCSFYSFDLPSGVNFSSFSLNSSSVLTLNVDRSNVSGSFNGTFNVIDLVNGSVSTFVFTFDSTRTSLSLGPAFSGNVYFYSFTNSNISTSNNLIISTPFVAFARESSDYIYAPFPQPVYDPYHSYFADSEHFYMITSDIGSVLAGSLPFMSYASGSMQILSSTDGLRLYDAVFPSVSKYGNNQFKFTLHNSLRDSSYSVNFYISQFDISSGQLISNFNISVNAGSTYDYPFYVSDPDLGFWCLGLTQDNSLTNVPLLSIRWSDTIDYSNQLNSVTSLLNQLYSEFVDLSTLLSVELADQHEHLTTISGYMYLIYQRLGSINTTVSNIYNLVLSHFNWFESTFYDNLNQKWTFTNNYLLSIYNLLNETDETMTIEDNTSGVAAMESAKNNLVITNAAGQTVDAGEAAAAGLSEAAQQIGEIAQPVSTINQLMQTIVFDKPKLLLPVIVALGLGLMVTILGKNKSD